MSQSATRRPATVEEQSPIPVLETDVVFADLLICISSATLSLATAILLLFNMSAAAWGGQLTLAFFFIAIAMWAAWSSETYHLYTDKLLIKKPLTYLSSTTTVIPLSSMKEVTIKTVKYRHRRTYLTIKTRSRTYQYTVSRDMEFIDTFIAKLQQLGVNAHKDSYT